MLIMLEIYILKSIVLDDIAFKIMYTVKELKCKMRDKHQ